MILGSIHNGDTVAHLHDDGRWQSDDTALQDELAARFHLADFDSVALGPLGLELLCRAARELGPGWTVDYPERPEPEGPVAY